MGNHEWSDNHHVPSPPNAYLNYFTLPPGPGSERYYDFQWGPVHFFALDSDSNEPDGNTSTSVQARWLQEQLQGSEAPWKLVNMHHPPFASAAIHPLTGETDWPFAEWGASLVLSGHQHFYERIEHDSLAYIINGSAVGSCTRSGRRSQAARCASRDITAPCWCRPGRAIYISGTSRSTTQWIDSLHMVNAAPVCQGNKDPKEEYKLGSLSVPVELSKH